MSKIHGFGAGADKKDDKKKNEELYGGGKSSGTAVMRPTGDPDDMAALINAARGQAGEQGDAQDRNVGLITVYKNGFVIGDGEFRDKKEPKNAAFIQALLRGETPPELEQEAIKTWGPAVATVGIELRNKTTEEYVPPKPKFTFGESKGQSLASAPVVVASFGTASPKEYILPAGEAKTVVQLVLANRTRVRAEFSETATVMQLYQHVMHLSKAPKFNLMSGFPPKALSNPSATLKEAGLCNSSVTQQM